MTMLIGILSSLILFHVLVFLLSLAASREDVPNTGLLYVILSFAVLLGVYLYEAIAVPSLALNPSDVCSLFAFAALAYGLARWVPHLCGREERNDLLRELILLQEQILRADKGRVEFMRSFSYDIRSALQNLHAFTFSNAEVAEAEKLRRATYTVAQIVDTYLVAQELDNTLLVMNNTKFSLREVLTQLVDEELKAAARPGLCLDIDTSVPELLFVDEAKLKQIIVDLAQFLVRHSEGEAEVRLTVAALRLDEKCVELKFFLSAADAQLSEEEYALLQTCIGLSKEQYTSKMSYDTIRVANASKVLLVFGGALHCDQIGEAGCEFSFSIPVQRYQGQRIERDAGALNTISSNRFDGLRVLVVDDDLIHREVLSRALEELGCLVEAVDGARSALGVLSQRPIDFIFIDCEMPEIDGYEATRFIRRLQRKSGKNYPIVAVTAHVLKDSQRKCVEAGMDGFVCKPADPHELSRAIQQHLQDYDFEIGEESKTRTAEQRGKDSLELLN